MGDLLGPQALIVALVSAALGLAAGAWLTRRQERGRQRQQDKVARADRLRLEEDLVVERQRAERHQGLAAELEDRLPPLLGPFHDPEEAERKVVEGHVAHVGAGIREADESKSNYRCR